jgi:hypothetical protein
MRSSRENPSARATAARHHHHGKHAAEPSVTATSSPQP